MNVNIYYSIKVLYESQPFYLYFIILNLQKRAILIVAYIVPQKIKATAVALLHHMRLSKSAPM